MNRSDMKSGFPVRGARSYLKRIPILFMVMFVCLLVANASVSAQDSSRFRWEVRSEKKSSDTYVLHFHTEGSAGWQIYAPASDFGDGVKAVVVHFTDSNLMLERSIEANGEAKKIHSSIFDHREFTVFEKSIDLTAEIRFTGKVPGHLLGTLQYTYGKGNEFYPLESFSFSVDLDGGASMNQRILIPTIDLNKSIQECGSSGTVKSKGLLAIFLLGFLGGLLALLTPCVFPMIPLTVSFFTKRPGGEQKGGGQAVLYGLFIFLIYIAFSIPFHVLGRVSPTIYNDISTNVWLNIFFFMIFVVFAISFFGYFEITLPSGLANRASAQNGTSLLGVFFMALTLAIVSFSCTGPILGTLLVGTASGGAWPLSAGLAGFGIALGLPFALFAMFPNWLQSLPKSGGWLHTVKVVLGFVELALALKFFSNADLVAHWGILKRELFFALWVIISLALFAFLMGWFHFGQAEKELKASPFRKWFAMFVLLFAIFLIPGVTNTRYANIGWVSGFPPPACYSLYRAPVNCKAPLNDYELALEVARREHRPIMIDFTGWACVNCRKMEENIWTRKEISELMNKYVLVSLYVDDKMQLPASAQFIYTAKDGSRRRVSTVGEKWSNFQTENFNASSQPWYVLLSPDEHLLNSPIGYTPDAGQYAAWLRCGLEAFERTAVK